MHCSLQSIWKSPAKNFKIRVVQMKKCIYFTNLCQKYRKFNKLVDFDSVTCRTTFGINFMNDVLYDITKDITTLIFISITDLLECLWLFDSWKLIWSPHRYHAWQLVWRVLKLKEAERQGFSTSLKLTRNSQNLRKTSAKTKKQKTKQIINILVSVTYKCPKHTLNCFKKNKILSRL